MLVTGPVFNTADQLVPLFVERTTPPLVKLIAPSKTLVLRLPAPAGSTTKALNVPLPPPVDRRQPVQVVQLLPASSDRRTPQPVRPPFPSPVAAYTIDGLTGSRAIAPIVRPHSASVSAVQLMPLFALRHPPPDAVPTYIGPPGVTAGRIAAMRPASS